MAMERAHTMPGRWLLAAVLAALALGRGVAAQLAPSGVDPLLSAADGDLLDLAATAAKLGDDAVLLRLRPEATTQVRLLAIRATPFLHAPERALPGLAVIAGGRDPDLAPAAARRAFTIAQELQSEGLASREILPASLSVARAMLVRLASSALVRADISLWAAQAAQLLGALGVPTAPAN